MDYRGHGCSGNMWNVGGPTVTQQEPATPFMEGLREIWGVPRARNFTLFVFLSMNAYFMQELILEPYAGLVFNFTPGQSTQLSGAQNGGVFLGMLTVGIVATGLRVGSLRAWVTGAVSVLRLCLVSSHSTGRAPHLHRSRHSSPRWIFSTACSL